VRQEIQDSDCYELPVQTIALVPRSQSFFLVAFLDRVSLQSRTEEALEIVVLPFLCRLFVDGGLILEKEFISVEPGELELRRRISAN